MLVEVKHASQFHDAPTYQDRVKTMGVSPSALTNTPIIDFMGNVLNSLNIPLDNNQKGITAVIVHHILQGHTK